jgi:quercetin dioxygenase-like cupin family protein
LPFHQDVAQAAGHGRRQIAIRQSLETGDAMKQLLIAAVIALGPCAPAGAEEFRIKPVAEKRLKELPPAPLYWRVETFPTLTQAQAAAGATGLPVEVHGKAWLFTLGSRGTSTPGANKLVEIGPVPPISAPEYLLRINYTGGPAGVKTPVHTHPGSEAFYVLTGRLGQHTPHGTMHAEAGRAMNGHNADTPMQVFSAGPGELNALVMFVVDATRPFSSPAKMP